MLRPDNHFPSTISGISHLNASTKREIFTNLIPVEVQQRFNLPADYKDENGHDLFQINCPDGSPTAEMALYHRNGFADPVLYGHITDTLNAQIHILLYVINDPTSPRFDIDRLPDGTPTNFGTEHRNIEAELAALRFGLAPGQIRRGLRMLKPAILAFERFIYSLGNDLFFAQPLYYHNAIIFERYGFAYEKGHRLMDEIQAGFKDNGELIARLDGSTPFRQAGFQESIRLRSWAIHDGLLGLPFTDVTMYKRLGKHAGVNTCQGCNW
jgi:hypothetical protein